MTDGLAGLLRDCIARSADGKVVVEDNRGHDFRVSIADREHGPCIGIGPDIPSAASFLLDHIRRLSGTPGVRA
jgi:hypothetical protein